MPSRIRHRRSATPGAAPTTGQIENGELAVNTRDGRIYTRQDDGVTPRVVGIGIVGLQVFTASGDWTKPAGLHDDALIWVEMWGGGGGGGRKGGISGSSAGGSGGSYIRAAFRAGDLPGTVAVTVGGGGAAGASDGANGANGGNSTFGALLTAPGGGGGHAIAGTSTPGGFGSHGGTIPVFFGETDNGGEGGTGGAVGNGAVSAGGGGGGAHTVARAGGTSRWGGAGGAGGGNSPVPTAGSVPGGGGGASLGTGNAAAPGARGEVRVWIQG